MFAFLRPIPAALVVLLLTLSSGPGAEGRAAGSESPGGSAASGQVRPGRVFVSGLRIPVAMAFTPDGRLLVNELDAGEVRVVSRAGRLLPTPFARVKVASTAACGNAYDEWGLIGIAVDPEYESNRYVFVYYLEPAGKCRARPVVVRFKDRGNRGVNPEVIARLPVTTGGYHVAGNLHFGPDRFLYLSFGDNAGDPMDAQRVESPRGKILRFDRDGRAPADNPFVGVPGADERVYARGARNSFDFTWDDEGRMFATENGPEKHDEVNRIHPGANYGWPCYTGRHVPYRPCDAPARHFRDPMFVWQRTVAPTGLWYYDHERFPELRGSLLACEFNTGDIRRLPVSPSGNAILRDLPFGEGCRYDIVAAEDGRIFYTDNTSIMVIS